MPKVELPRLDDPRFKANPYPTYARLRSEASVYRTSVAFWLPAIWIVTRYDDVVKILKDPRFSKDYTQAYPWIPPSLRAMLRNLLTIDPPDHTRLRSLVQKAFTPRLIEGLRARIQGTCDELLDRADGSDMIELIEAYALPVPLIIISDLLGVPVKDRRRFGPWTKKAAAASASASLGVFVRALPVLASLSRYIRGLLTLRRASPQDDLMTALVRAEESGDRLTEDEIVSMVILLLTGRTRNDRSSDCDRIAAPDAASRAANAHDGEPGTSWICHRRDSAYASPVEFATPRLTLEDVTIGAVTIPHGELVGVSLGSANHDESQFLDPEIFDIAREPNKHVAFGMGSHFCLGAALARLEGEIALTSLYRRFPGLQLAAPPHSLRWRASLALRGLVELPVRTNG